MNGPARAAWDDPVEDRGYTKAELTRRRILDAAAKVFRARGFVGSRLTDIAAEANLQAGSLYYHFASREALVEAVMWAGQLRTEEQVRQQLAALGPEATPMQRLHTAVEAHLLAVLSSTDANSASIKMIGQVPPDSSHNDGNSTARSRPSASITSSRTPGS